MANLKDMLEQIKTVLLARNWPGGSNPVFGTGSVKVSRYLPLSVLRTMRVPAAQVMPGAGRSDPQHDEEPDLLVVPVIVRYFMSMPGDAVGENALMGANRPDTTKSEGAGLLEVIEQGYAAIGKLNVADHDNFKIQYRRKGGQGAVHVDENVMWQYQDEEYEAVCTAT